MTTEEEILATIGKNLRSRRSKLGLTQQMLADRCKIPRTYIADVESGRRNLSVKTLGRIARGIRLRMTQLIRGL